LVIIKKIVETLIARTALFLRVCPKAVPAKRKRAVIANNFLMVTDIGG
jgi:hypothetical protein